MTAAASPLEGVVVLVLEDDYFLAEDTRRTLSDAGATVVGPFRDPAAAIRTAEERPPDCAVVDVNLGGGPDFEPARRLLGRGIQVVFVTGYDERIIPADLSHLPCVQKPAAERAILEAVRIACAA